MTGLFNENRKGHLAAISANLIFGFNITISKSLIAASWMTPIGLTMIRLLCSLVIFWIIGLLIPREKTSPRDHLFMSAAALLGIVMAQLTFNLALRFTTSITMALVSALNPIIVLLLSVLFSIESASTKKIIGVIIGISGAVLVVLNNKGGDVFSASVLGLLLAIVSVTCYASYILVARKIAGKFTSITMMKWVYFWAVILLSPLGIPELSKQRLFSSEINALPILQLAYTIVFSSIIGFFLTPLALQRIKATTVSMYINLQPLTASVAAIIIGQDVFSWDKPLALLLIITGVYLVTQKNVSENNPIIIRESIR